MRRLKQGVITQRLSRYRKSTLAVALLLVATFAGAGLNFAIQVLLARTLGVEQFGAFASALAMVTLLAPLAGFGLGGYWLNVYGREGWGAQRWLPGSFRFLAFSTVSVVVVLLAWAWFGPHDTLTTILLSILTGYVIGQAAVMLTHAKYQLEGRQAWLAWWQLLPHLLRITAVGAMILLIGQDALSAIHAAIAFTLAAVVLVVLGAVQLGHMSAGRLALEGHTATTSADEKNKIPGIRKVVSGAWPFGLAGVFYLIYFQSDIILIKYLMDDAAAGIYHVAFVVMAAVYLFPSVFYQQFLLPKLHRWAYHDKDRLYRTYRLGNLVMLAVGVGAMIMLWLLVTPVVPWLFGDDYRAAVGLLMILAVAAPFRFLASSAGAPLTTRNLMRIKVRLMGLAALINVVLNLILIPRFGSSGAAVATVMTEFLIMVAYFSYFQKVVAIDGLSKKVV